MVTGTVPHVGGPILPPAAVTVLTGGLPQSRIGDMCTCVGPPDVIAKGSVSVLVQGSPAARIGDMTAHGGVIVTGFATVLIGDFSAPGPLALGAPQLVAAAQARAPFCERCAEAAAADARAFA